MENGVVTVLYFFTKERGYPSSHFMTFGTPSSNLNNILFLLLSDHIAHIIHSCRLSCQIKRCTYSSFRKNSP